MSDTLITRLDSDRRRTYSLLFPRDFKADAVLALVRSLSGPLEPQLLRPAVTIAAEIYADAGGLAFFVTLPRDRDVGLRSLISSHVPGLILVPTAGSEDRIAAEPWDDVIEIGTSRAHRPLRLDKPESAVVGLLSAFGNLRTGEALALQWVIAGSQPRGKLSTEQATRSWQRQDSGAHNAKYAEPTFLAVGRLAARGPNPDQLLARVGGFLASLRTHGVSLQRQRTRTSVTAARLRARAGVLAFPAHLNATEVAALIGWPCGRPAVPGLPISMSRRLPADEHIPRTGLVVARSNYPGSNRLLGFHPDDLVKHLHVQGKTGVGKSVFMVNLAVAQMEAGYGVGLIDPTGDTTHELLERIPPHRRDDVIVFDPTDIAHPVGFNVFAGVENPEVLADQMMAIFHGIYHDNGIYVNNYLRGAIQALCSVPGMTVAEIPAFLTDDRFRASVLDQISDEMLRFTWERFGAQRRTEQMQMVAPAINRIQPLLMRQSVLYTLGQSQNQLDMARIFAERKILVVSLPKGPLGEETAQLFGSLVFARLWQAAMARPRADRHPFFLHIDEAQNFLHMPLPMDQVLDEARKYGFGLTLAHQRESQLPPLLRSAIHANTRTKVYFRLSADDARSVARELGPPIEPEDLVSLGKFEVVIQATTAEVTCPPATAVTLAPAPVTGSAEDLRAIARRWARPIEEVKTEIIRRQRRSAASVPPPSGGWEVA